MSKLAIGVFALMLGGLAFSSYAGLNGIGVSPPEPEIKKSPLRAAASSADDDDFFFFSSSSVRSGSSRSGRSFSSFGGK